MKLKHYNLELVWLPGKMPIWLQLFTYSFAGLLIGLVFSFAFGWCDFNSAKEAILVSGIAFLIYALIATPRRYK